MEKAVMPKSTYVYGAGEIENLAEHVKIHGTRSFILMDSFLMETTGQKISKSYAAAKSFYKLVEISEEDSREDVTHRLVKEANSFEHIIGIGSGRTLDLANEIAYMKSCPYIVIPFITFTNASCSGYLDFSTEDYAMYSREPNLIIIDNQIVADAPVSFLLKGMEETLSVYFDLRAAIRYSSKISRKADLDFELMRLKKNYEQLLEYGLQGVRDAKKHLVTLSLNKVIEACLHINYAFNSKEGLRVHSKSAVIHAVRNGLVMLKGESYVSNEEEISFAILVLLVLENVSTSELFEILSFLWGMGLPITLEEIGIYAVDSERMKLIANIICAQKMVFGDKYVMPAEIVAAIITADSLGMQYLIEKSVNSGSH